MGIHVSNRGAAAIAILFALRLAGCGGDSSPSDEDGGAGGADQEPGGAAGASGASGAESDAGTGDDSSAGHGGGTAGRSMGSAGRAGSAGSAGSRPTGGTGGAAPTGGGTAGTNHAGAGRDEGGASGNPGSGSGGEGGSDACDLPNACSSPGLSCDGNDRVECVPDGGGCFVETRTSCNLQTCAAGVCVENGTGDSCSSLLVIDTTTLIGGDDFASDYGDDQDFVGKGCVLASRASSEAVFAINVPAGGTVLLREIGETLDASDTSIDAVLGFLGDCSDSAACLTSRRGPDWAGVAYTATESQTVYGFVGAEGNPNGSYRIAIEYPESLGTVGAGATIPPVHGGAMSDAQWTTYVLTLTQDAVVYGALERDGTSGDVDIRVYDETGAVHISDLPTDEDFAYPLSAGEYRVEITAASAVSGYTLSLFTDAFTRLPVLDLGDSLGFASGAIQAGRSRFYLLDTTSGGVLNIGVIAKDKGDPDIFIYDGLGLIGSSRATGLIESLGLTLDIAGTAPIVRVVADETAGDIPSHQFLAEFGATDD